MDIDPGAGGDGSVQSAPPALIGNSNDVGWKYGKYCDPTNKSKVKCDFCGHISTGGIYRFKKHIVGVHNVVASCKKATPEAKEACRKALEKVIVTKGTKRQHEQDLRDDVHISSSVGLGEDQCAVSSTSTTNKLGPMDKFVRPIDGKSSKEEALKQLSMNEALFKERVHQVSQYVARWVYTHAIPFNALDNDEFKQMCEAIGKFGPGYEPPSQFDLREKLLSEEYARTKSLLDERESQKNKLGCTIMTDAWTDMKRRSIMNVCMHCSGGTSFLKSKETSDVSHTGEVIFELVDKAIEDVGAEHVMQVCTDNASNNMAAKKLLLEKRPKIFWTSCATHTINLMLQGIGNIKRFKSIVDQATSWERADFNPVGWWKLYGTDVPLLQKMAMRILSLTCSSSGCERNWSIYEMNHTRRRNRLTTDRLNNMVYIQFNTRMLSKRQRLKDKKKADSLLSNDASEAQGWLFEGGDDHAMVVFRDEEDGDQGVHPDTGIPYDVIGEAMGAHEQLQVRRSTRNMRDLEEEEFESEEEDVLEEDEVEYEDDDEY